MSKNFTRNALCLLVILAGAALLAVPNARSTPAQQTTVDHPSFELASLRGRGRVCCGRGWQDWWTTSDRACRRYGGRPIANRHCRNNWNDRWDTRWWGWEGRNWNNNVCCTHGRMTWRTTARECRNSFGFVTANRLCRR